MPKGWEITSSQSSDKEENNDEKLKNNIKSNHIFSSEDLFALVKNLELEININEGNLIYNTKTFYKLYIYLIFLGLLKEQNEQRNKYKIDDCRRTHNYDQFISMFLAMLAEQRILPRLLQNLGTQKQNTSAQLSLPVQSQSTNQAQVKSKPNKTISKIKKTSTKRKTATKKQRK